MSSFAWTTARNGYQKLPSGMIIQWGTIDSPLALVDGTTYFPIAFPTACLRVFASQDYTPGSGSLAYIGCNGFTSDPVKFITRCSLQGIGASFLALGF